MGKTLTFNERPWYNNKLSDGETSLQELWEIWSTPSLPLVPGLLWSRVVVPDRILYMTERELYGILTVSKQMTYDELNC